MTFAGEARAHLKELKARREGFESQIIRGAPETELKYRELVARIDELGRIERLFEDKIVKFFTGEEDE